MYGAVDLGRVKEAAQAKEASGAGIPALTEVTAANLEEAVLQRSTQVPVVVLVGTGRSPESEDLKADLAALAEESRRAFLVGYVDADRAPEVAQVFGVQVLPTVVAVAAGRPVTSFEGGQPRQALQQWTDALVTQVGGQLTGLAEGGGDDAPEASDEHTEFEVAVDLAARGHDAQAGEIFERLAQEEQNDRAAAYLALFRRLAANRAAWETSEGDEATVALADEHAWAGRLGEAFDLVLGLVSTGDKERGRKRLLELLRLCDPADPVVTAARTRLASALF
ncbi:tetratricopeptide repeat protein [Corynebacterium sp. zg-331]|nr:MULTISPECIES: tetratricopeptide repeat protein [unclassified Corynebacterium]MBC3186213.1 tetratricopeptide repeat protein [Corynebacterium sp. zg-331]MPV52700.1 tetratricopeptide repeat protein [Corynebacterium sp. zg331]